MKLFLLFLCIGSVATEANERAKATPATLFDVIHYDAQIEPDLAKKNVAGRVLIKLKAAIDDLATVELDCGDLTIDAVRENRQEQKFVRTDRHLVVSLARPAKIKETRELEVRYHGTPARGIRFFPDQEQVYTVFSTSEWLVCVDALKRRQRCDEPDLVCISENSCQRSSGSTGRLNRKSFSD